VLGAGVAGSCAGVSVGEGVGFEGAVLGAAVPDVLGVAFFLVVGRAGFVAVGAAGPTLGAGAEVCGAVPPTDAPAGFPCGLEGAVAGGSSPRCPLRRASSWIRLVRAPVREALSPRVSDVRKKTTARIVVARLRKVAAPRPPKSVWLEPAPKAPASPPPLPDWRRIDAIRATQQTT